MRTQPRSAPMVRLTHWPARTHWVPATAGLLALAILSGCGLRAPQATVEGTLRLGGKPLDNCLVTFLPVSAKEGEAAHSRGRTDRQGKFRLSHDNQEEGALVGCHRVTVQDLSVSTGVHRRDHGAADAGMEEGDAVLSEPVRRSRVPKHYTSAATTPLSKEVRPGHQVIDLDIQ